MDHMKKYTAQTNNTTPQSFPIACVCGSAGSLEALKDFFSNVPAGSGIGFVVLTHQHPEHSSLLPELLGKVAHIQVQCVENNGKVKPDTVYVSTPGVLLTICKGVLSIRKSKESSAPYLPIDYFLHSLAEDQRENAICIILSGSGSDGTLGVQAIKSESGMVMAQKPSCAKYEGMPSSAIATGSVDFVLPADKMPETLLSYISKPFVQVIPIDNGTTKDFPESVLQKILAALRLQTGHDFTGYKPNSLCRRIDRRMHIHQIKDPKLYTRLLTENTTEAHLLFKELLIGVTRFFRDPDLFETLSEKILPEILSSCSPNTDLRIWNPGCATGEESYSLAIAIHECMQNIKRFNKIHIFATDLDKFAIEKARSGLYSDTIAEAVSKIRLEQYFIRKKEGFLITKKIRDMIVFAPQNVLSDPVFSKLHMIVCRNLLIYLSSTIQKKLLRHFHYALNSGGFLILGPSESIGRISDIFQTINRPLKIFQQKEVGTKFFEDMQKYSDLPLKIESKEKSNKYDAAPQKLLTMSTMIESLLLNRFAPFSVVTRDDGYIVYIHGRSGLYLEPEQGKPSNNILEMAREGLRLVLTTAIRKVVSSKKVFTRERIKVKTNGGYTLITVSISPIKSPEQLRGLLLIALFPSPSLPDKKTAKIKKTGRTNREQELEQELMFTKESHQTSIEELETANEELKSSVEELQSINEELQSTNEEMETSKEEMQSLNEELTTVNNELQGKIEELNCAKDDMQNLLNSTDQAIIFLDEDLRVKRYTEQVKKIVRFIDSDVGRPLEDLAINIDYDNIITDCKQVLQTLERKEKELQSYDGKWILLRILPYRTSENLIVGIVIVFSDIDNTKRSQHEAEIIGIYFRNIVQTIREPIVVIDAKGHIQYCNKTFCTTFKIEEADVMNKLIYTIQHTMFDIPDLKKLLEEILPQKKSFSNFIVVIDIPYTGEKTFQLNAQTIHQAPGLPDLILLAMEEMSMS